MAKIRKRSNAWQIDYFDPDGKRVRKSFKKKKEAEAELGKRVSLIAEGRYLDVKKDYRTTLEEVMAGWKKSPGHNKNLLLPDAEHMGIALVHDPKTEFRTFWTLVLGSRI